MGETGYTIIRTEAEDEAYVKGRIGEIPDVNVYSVRGLYGTGPFNILARIEADDLGEFRDIMNEDVRRIGGLKGSLTFIIEMDGNVPIGFSKNKDGKIIYCHKSLE